MIATLELKERIEELEAELSRRKLFLNSYEDLKAVQKLEEEIETLKGVYHRLLTLEI